MSVFTLMGHSIEIDGTDGIGGGTSADSALAESSTEERIISA